MGICQGMFKRRDKYLYAADDPVNLDDPSGNDYGDFNLSLGTILGSALFSVPGLAQAAPNVVASGVGTCGPDVTKLLQNTMQNIRQTAKEDLASDPGLKKKLLAEIPWGMQDGWDIDPLYQMGYGALFPYEYPGVFGAGCSAGSGAGDRTIQFSINGKTGVYYGGSVNYIIWGEMFSLIGRSESAAVAYAWGYKTFGQWDFGMTKEEADAFVRFGYSGTDPSSTALPLPTNPGNAPTSLPPLGRMKWKWIGIPGHEQAE